MAVDAGGIAETGGGSVNKDRGMTKSKWEDMQAEQPKGLWRYVWVSGFGRASRRGTLITDAGRTYDVGKNKHKRILRARRSA